MKKIIPATQARQNFFQILAAAKRPGNSITITMEGEPQVVMMPVEDFESWQETLEVLSDPKLMKSIRLAQKGKLYTATEVKRRFNLSE